jgi:hypothetical protein
MISTEGVAMNTPETDKFWGHQEAVQWKHWHTLASFSNSWSLLWDFRRSEKLHLMKFDWLELCVWNDLHRGICVYEWIIPICWD